MNNNNTYNRYFVVGASELSFDFDEWLDAEQRYFRNQHDNISACRLHYKPGRIMPIARKVADGSFAPGKSYCFYFPRPVLREIFAAYPPDRLVHHFVAPFISQVAECVYAAYGDVSHGNRLGHSARTAVEEVRKAIGKWRYVIRMDFQGFFMSIPRELAYQFLEACARLYYSGADIDEKLAICRTLILFDPTSNCEYVGDISYMDMIDPRKSMRFAKPGCGLPMGNFYSQLIANLFLAIIDAIILSFGVDMSRFVDDITTFAQTREQARAIKAAVAAEARRLGLTLHPYKYSVQPAHRGVSMCGYTVKGNRVYLNNRTVSNCKEAINTAPATLDGARAICKTLNSYYGLLRHCTERKLERKIADAVLEKFGAWLYFLVKDGHYVCRLKQQYTDIFITTQLINTYKDETRKNYKRDNQPRRSRGWQGGRRAA